MYYIKVGDLHLKGYIDSIKYLAVLLDADYRVEDAVDIDDLYKYHDYGELIPDSEDISLITKLLGECGFYRPEWIHRNTV